MAMATSHIYHHCNPKQKINVSTYLIFSLAEVVIPGFAVFVNLATVPPGGILGTCRMKGSPWATRVWLLWTGDLPLAFLKKWSKDLMTGSVLYFSQTKVYNCVWRWY